MKNDTLKGQYRINEQIRAKEVRIAVSYTHLTLPTIRLV